MTGRLELPNPRFKPSGRYKPKYLNPDDQLVRVAKLSSSYSPCDWNTSRHPLGLDVSRVGRFNPISRDRFEFLYGAESSSQEAVAIQETLRSKLRRSSSGQWVLPFAELKSRCLTVFQVPHRLTLVDLRDQAGREHFGATEELQYSENRDATRKWCRYIRRNAPDEVHGMAYNSTQETANLGSASFILWQTPGANSCRMIERSTTDLDSSAGQELVMRAFAGFDILIG